MRDDRSQVEWWLADVREHIIKVTPQLLPLFDTYAEEALFGRSYIAADLMRLQPGTRVLEVGAGALLLSCQLVREGFEVTAVEPTGKGFGHFEQIRQQVLERAAVHGCVPKILNLVVEDFVERDYYAYAFSVNVMEHVKDIALAIYNIGNSLIPGACYRFTCPNYIFPYEPHFNIITLFSKRLTGKIFWRKILSCDTMPDPVGAWDSINWINIVLIKKVVRKIPCLHVDFNRACMAIALERIVSDPAFAGRRSSAVRGILRLFVRLRMSQLFTFMPAVLQPIIDCRLHKARDSEKC